MPMGIHQGKGKRMIRMCIAMDHQNLTGLKTLSAKTGAPVSELIRRAVSEYLEKKEAFLVHARSVLQKKGV